MLSTWALTKKGELLLLEVFKTKLEGPGQVDFIKAQFQKWHPVGIGFESVGIGKTTYQNLVRERLPVIDLEPKGDKFSRALSAAIRLGNKTTYFLQEAHWLNDFETELLHFPNVKHDDQTDTFSQADYMLLDMKIQNKFAFSVDDFSISNLCQTRYRG